MVTDLHKPERVTGWVLAGVLFFHLVLVRVSAGTMLLAAVVLFVGAILRGRRILVPSWMGRVLLLLGVALVAAVPSGVHPTVVLGGMAGVAGAMFLLRPVTPARGLKVLLCILVTLTAIILKPYETVGAAFVVLDVVVLLVLAEQIHRPPEAVLSLWVSLMRSLRVVVPVAIVVTMVFWLFPNLSIYTPPAFTGFSGGGVLNPGVTAELIQSRRVALVARFSRDQEIPPAGDLYWRGQVLENNEGLRWSRVGASFDRARSLQQTAPQPDGTGWRYSQEMMSNRGGIVPALDHAVFVEASRDGQDVAVLDIGGAVLTAVGVGPLKLDVASSADRVADAPLPLVSDGATYVPKEIWENPDIAEIAGRVVPPARSTTENLAALADYLRDSGFVYTRRPGRMPDLARFLVKQRRGFCEHYAAAAANLLRLGGVPARIVTGYRGGEWNPWLRTITVRDSEAHAWVEAWDAPSQRWLRFDPTDSVAPDLTAQLEREMDSDRWPWYRLALSYGSAAATSANARVEEIFTRVSSSEVWGYLPPILAGFYLLAALGWLIRNHRKRSASGPASAAILVREDLERRAARFSRPRRAGETPLAWLERLRRAATGPAETDALDEFVKDYERGVYRANGPDVSSELRMGAKRLCHIWKTSPSGV